MFDRRLLASFGYLLLAGCSLTPTFLLPDPPIPKQWPGELTTAQALPRDPHPLPWQTFYAHPLLQKLITAALESSRDLKAASARMEKAAALSGVAFSARLPAMQGDVGNQAVRTPGDLSLSRAPSISRRADIGVSLPAFELDFWGRLASLEEASKSTFLASEETAYAMRIVLISQVMETFIIWREMQERILIEQVSLETQQTLRNLAEQRVTAGVTTAQTELLAAMELERIRAELTELQRQASLANNALQLLTGEAMDELLPWPSLEGLDLTTNLQLALPEEVLTTRPDVRAAEHRLMAANANVGAARAAFWPRIVLTTALGTASQGLNGLFDQGSLVWSFVPKLDVPIFDFSKRKNELSAVKAERTALLAEYEKIVQQAFREVADALTSRDRLMERLKAQFATRDGQQARLNLIRDRFQAGVDGKQEVLMAEQELYATEQQIRTAQKSVLINQIALYKALGGGVQ